MTVVGQQGLGRAGLRVSSVGLGCMGMSGTYGRADWDRSIATIHRAWDLGVTLFDTADIYGQGHNEVLVGRAVHDRRGSVQIATKFGIDRSLGRDRQVARGEAAYVRACCDASLLRLGIDEIDLYYVHRPPADVEIEETIGAMSELVTAGKVRCLGVSEFDAGLLRRAHAVHPITAMQSEYSVWTREVEAVAPTMAELGVGLVAFSPLGRGFLSGTLDRSELTASDFRARNARFVGAAGDANEDVAATVRQVAQRLEVSPAQVALSWVYAQRARLGVDIVTIPGTKNPDYVEQNVGALDVVLDSDALEILAPLTDIVQGDRYGMR
jgi:aryl-alcohol dehydrogenase-like predicted oxidoreductase